MKFTILALCLGFLSCGAFADSPQVLGVRAHENNGTWRFDVTLRHGDTGWEHYADGWGVYSPDGTELGYRVLVHPHVREQPFTRSLSGVRIPAGTPQVIIRPHDLVHGDGAGFTLVLE